MIKMQLSNVIKLNTNANYDTKMSCYYKYLVILYYITRFNLFYVRPYCNVFTLTGKRCLKVYYLLRF